MERLSLWATLGIFLAIALLFVGAELVVGMGFMAIQTWRHPESDLALYVHNLSFDGIYFSLTTLARALFCTALLGGFLKMQGLPVARYLALKKFAWPRYLFWQITLIAYLVCSEYGMQKLGFPVVHEFMETIYKNAGSLLLLWIALIIAAPLLEELVFRGLLYQGIATTRLAVPGAIIIPALLWALTHFQYHGIFMGIILGGGILLGLARWHTGSTLATLGLHASWNLISTLLAHYYLGS
ncbi:MAG: CPBP family intramembrane metalloprotease [Deltaproteobacteria bacterium]|nr:CPBP family intramembrane metalloprotease [Deltaproteobacteria bacterium]